MLRGKLHSLNFASVYSLKYFYEAASSREPFIERYQRWPSHVLALSLSDSYYFDAEHRELKHQHSSHTELQVIKIREAKKLIPVK